MSKTFVTIRQLPKMCLFFIFHFCYKTKSHKSRCIWDICCKAKVIIGAVKIWNSSINGRFQWDDPLKIGARDLISHCLSANQIASLFFKTNHRKVTKIIFSFRITIWKLFNPLIALLGNKFTFIFIFFNPLAARFKFQTTLRTPQYIDVVNCWGFGARKSTVQRLIGNDVGTVHANNLNVPFFCILIVDWLVAKTLLLPPVLSICNAFATKYNEYYQK